MPDFNSGDENNVPEDALAGVTTTRGGGQVNHSIDATPTAPRVRPVEPQGQSFFGYMASQLYSPAQGVQFSPAIESPLPEAQNSAISVPMEETSASAPAAQQLSDVEIAASQNVSSTAQTPSLQTAITDETVAAATREIELLDSRRSVLETTVMQAEMTSLSAEMESSSSSAPIPAFGGGYAKFVSAGMESSSSSSVPLPASRPPLIPGANTGRLIQSLVPPKQLAAMAKKMSRPPKATEDRFFKKARQRGFGA